MRGRLTIVVFAATLFVSIPARADHQEAVRLFDDGRRLRDQKEFEKAARAFERSLKEEPSIGAYYNLGLVSEQLDKLRDAADAYRASKALAQKKNDSRVNDAVDALGKLLDTHNYITLTVPDEVATLPGLRVVVDGEDVPRAQFNGEVFRKETTHAVAVTAVNRKDLKLTVANKQPVTIALEVAGAEGAPPPPPPKEETKSGIGGWGWQKWTGVGVGAVGVAGIAISLIRVISYSTRQSRLDSARRAAIVGCKGNPMTQMITRCFADDATTPQPERVKPANDALQAWIDNENDAKDGAPLTVTVGVAGLLLVGGGIALFLTAPAPEKTEASPSSTERARARARFQLLPEVGPRESGLSVVGTF